MRAIQWLRLGVFAVLLGVSASLVTGDEQSGQGNFGSTWAKSENKVADHEPPGEVETVLSSNSSATAPLFVDASSFPIAPLAGGASASYKSTTKQPHERTLFITNAIVTVFTAKKNGNLITITDRSDVVGAFSSGCHDQVAAPAPTTTATGTSENIRKTEDSVESPLITFDADFTINGSGGYVFTYPVTNHTTEDLDFTWPAVRTPVHANGWSATVLANDSILYSYTGPGPALLVPSHATDVTLSTSGEILVSHGARAYSPSGSVVRPASVSGAAGTYSTQTGSVTLTWSNNGMYDKIQVCRELLGVADHGRAWRIPGAATAFVDEDPPVGDVKYTVTSIFSDMGPVEPDDAVVEVNE